MSGLKLALLLENGWFSKKFDSRKESVFVEYIKLLHQTQCNKIHRFNATLYPFVI